MRLASEPPPGRSYSPLVCAAIIASENSRSASGLPATRLRRDARCRHPAVPATWSRGVPETPRIDPLDLHCGSPASSDASPSSRTASTIPIDSASRRRATNEIVNTDARSSHCASSMMHTVGRSPAADDSKPTLPIPRRSDRGATSVQGRMPPRAHHVVARATNAATRATANRADEGLRKRAPSRVRRRQFERPGTPTRSCPDSRAAPICRFRVHRESPSRGCAPAGRRQRRGRGRRIRPADRVRGSPAQ